MTDLYNASLGEEEEVPMELTLEQYEEAKESLTLIIERAEAAKRLAANPDFKSLVLDGYMTDEPKRLAELMASGRLPAQAMDGCIEGVKSIGHFRNFMKMFMEQGHMATDELAALEEARDEAILAEEQAAAGE